MTWGEYRDRLRRLSAAFSLIGQPMWAVHYRTDASFLDGWPLGHLGREIEAEMLIRDLEQEEERAIEAIAETLRSDGATKYKAARAMFEEIGNTPLESPHKVEGKKKPEEPPVRGIHRIGDVIGGIAEKLGERVEAGRG